MTVEIKKVSSKKELRLFCEYPNKLYKGNPYYIPTLAADDFKTFDKSSNAAYEFCDADFFLAYKNGRIVGRVAAIVNPRANEAWEKKSGRFGWIDFIDDYEVSAALVAAAEQWARDRGLDEIEGPLGFTDFDMEGMLVEGFQELGTMITFYNHEYYQKHMEKLGYEKKTDWVERRITIPEVLPEKFVRFSKIIEERSGLHCVRYTKREINQKKIGLKLFNLVNQTYKILYGYSQLSEKQMEQYVSQYLSLLNLKFVSFVVDKDENLIAFGVMLPSLSKALQKCNGKYFPLGWWHLVRSLYMLKTDTIDMLLIAVHPDYQSKGIPALLVGDLFGRIAEAGFKYAETNPELETNHAVQNLWSEFDSRLHRRRRIYGKSLV